MLALGGILCVGCGILVSFGLASAVGLFYGPVQSVLPFLLLGIGVDDMFIIVNAIDQTDPDDDIEDRVGEALSSAGVSITVTSVTDMAGFAAGSWTALPALNSFCLFAVFGVLGIFIAQLTIFTALASLDTRRRDGLRVDCCCCCIEVPDEDHCCAGEPPTPKDDV